jgi:hypothetical protein
MDSESREPPRPHTPPASSEPIERSDPGATFNAEGVDLTAIRWMLSLTPLERLQAAQDLLDTARALRRRDEA